MDLGNLAYFLDAVTKHLDPKEQSKFLHYEFSNVRTNQMLKTLQNFINNEIDGTGSFGMSVPLDTFNKRFEYMVNSKYTDSELAKMTGLDPKTVKAVRKEDGGPLSMKYLNKFTDAYGKLLDKKYHPEDIKFLPEPNQE